MPLSVNAILGLDVLASGQPEVLVGEDWLDRPVRWVHVAEIDDVGDLLQGGELILTTGLAFSRPGADPRRFLRQLSRVPVSGLIVELSDRLPNVPRPVIEEGGRRGTPVIALHRPVRFVAITEAVHRLIVAEQYEDLAFAHRTHERFTALTLTGATVGDIVSVAADLAASPVVLEDLSHRVLAFAVMDQAQSDLLGDWERRSRRVRMSERVEATGPELWVAKPVGAPGSEWGRLIVVAPTAPIERLRMVLDRAADALQLTRMVEQSRADMWAEAQSSVIDDLARGRIKDERDALARVRSLRIEPGDAYVPLVALFPDASSGDSLRDIDSMRRQVRAVGRALEDVGLHGLIGQLAPKTLGLVLVLQDEDEDRSLAAFSTALRRQGNGVPVIGVATASDSLRTAGARLDAARQVADAATALGEQERRVYYRFADVRLRGLVAQLRDDERALAFAESELGPLLEHEADHQAGLLEVLRQYVAHNGNKSRVAQQTHRSRPAVYAMLNRIERILGVSLDAPESMVSLGVALLIHDQHRSGMATRDRL